MFKWFWTIFSLGAPEEGTGDLSDDNHKRLSSIHVDRNSERIK